MDPLNQSKLDLPWNRAHFGAYCIVSSPLVLDVDALATLAPVVPIITNKDAIDVNQAWEPRTAAAFGRSGQPRWPA